MMNQSEENDVARVMEEGEIHTDSEHHRSPYKLIENRVAADKSAATTHMSPYTGAHPQQIEVKFPEKGFKIGNPAPLGLMCFGMTTLMLMYVETEWVEAGFAQVVVCYGLFFGGGVQLLAGMWEMAKGNSFASLAFSSYGAFWLGWSILRVLKDSGFDWGPNSEGYDTAEKLFLGQWGVMSFLFFILSFKASRCLQFILAEVAITFFLLCIGVDHHGAKIAGGYFGLLAAASAIYLSIGELFHEHYGIRWIGV